MSGYLSGHAILSSGVRGRKGSYRRGGRKRGRAREREERASERARRGGGGGGGRGERNEGGLTEEGGKERERAR